MLDVIVLLIFTVGIILALIPIRKSTSSTKSQEPLRLYAPGSEDIAGGSYFPGEKDGSMPFPVGKKQERKKTETFRRHSDD